MSCSRPADVPRARFAGVFSPSTWEVNMAATQGTIKRLVSEKGFGFIMADSGQEYFFHQSACASFASLREGQTVTR